jgi:hypothetical protein
MKLKNLFLAFIACIAMFASCVKIDYTNGNRIPTNNKGEYAILFSQPTKAQITSTSGTGYDSFSLFAWNSINDTIMKPYTVNASGANAYQYDQVSGQELQYFKNVADSYDFIGVIPTTHTMTLKDGEVSVKDVVSFSVDDSRAEMTVNLTDTLYWSAGLAAESPEEFLTAYKNVVKADYASSVDLPFKHQNALIFLGFSSDRNDTELIDYVPGNPGSPFIPGTPDTETYTSKTTKFIDELVAGNEVQVAIGFYGVGSPQLTKTNPNPLYVGSDNTGNGWLAKTWLLSIKDAVNAQFVYYRLNQVNNSTSKTVTTEDWESAASNKNIFMMKLADGVDKAAFAAGNDVFWNALVAHDEGTADPWVGGSPVDSFKNMFVQAYADGWRVIRINVSDANANQVLVFLSSNIEKTTQVCTITPGTPDTTAVPATPAIEGVRVFSANSTPDFCTHIPHTTVADAVISSTGVVLNNRTTSDNVINFSLPATTTLSSTPVWSPSTFYALPGDTNLNYIVVKLSYTYNGVTVYDVRVPIDLPSGGLQPGKYYKYELYITSTGNGTNDPGEATTEEDEITIANNPIIGVRLVDDGYTQGDERRFTI